MRPGDLSEASTGDPCIKVKEARLLSPELDVARFLAFASVFLFHAILYSANWAFVVIALQLGMCLFFTLSSYLITELLLNEQATAGTIHIKAFYFRRILRIWPLYLVALGLAIFTALIDKSAHVSKGWVISYLFASGNWYNLFSSHQSTPWSPLWSISLEEQFYLLWPFLALAGVRFLKGFALFTFPLAWFAVTFLGKPWLGATNGAVWFNTLVHFQFFGAGGLLAIMLRGRSLIMTGWQRAALLPGYVGLVLTIGRIFSSDTTRINVFWINAGYAVAVVASIVLLLSLIGSRKESIPPSLISLGKISYGLYVFHLPVQYYSSRLLWTLHAHASRPIHMIETIAIAFPATIFVARLSYKWLEKPFLEVKKRFEFVHSRPA